ncbi:MAG: hypothetical protein M3680_21300, partial [Myxococcota bacterium]|nr:hypothetical protein [Myxococcota bacterium]
TPAVEPAIPAPAEVRPVDDRPVLRPTRRTRELVVEIPGERSTQTLAVVGGIAAAGLLGSALGLYWHLDSRDAADAVSSSRFAGRAWTSAQVDLVDRAERSKTRATVAYAVGGALVIGAVVAFIVTNPESQREVIRTGATIVPTEGGAVASKAWSF